MAVLSTEEQILGLRQPTGVGARPRPMATDLCNQNDATESAAGTTSGITTPLIPPPLSLEAVVATEAKQRQQHHFAVNDLFGFSAPAVFSRGDEIDGDGGRFAENQGNHCNQLFGNSSASFGVTQYDLQNAWNLDSFDRENHVIAYSYLHPNAVIQQLLNS